MVLNEDWERARQDLTARGRARTVDPPTPEEMIAYAQGELSESEEERIREALTYYPDLAKALSEDDGEEYERTLSDAELESDWNDLKRRLPRRLPVPPERSSPSSRPWQWATAASLMMVAILGGFYLRSVSTVRALRTELQQPREHVERVLLFEHEPRGDELAPQPIELQPTTEYVVLALTLVDDVAATSFIVEIRDPAMDPPAVLWTGTIPRGRDGTFSLEVPRSFFTSREHEINLRREGTSQPIATYRFSIGSG